MTDHETPTITRNDWLLFGILFALVLPLRLWLLCNTEVTARDSIGYIRYALQFERTPWHEVWEKNHQHPGYPICVYLMSLPVRAIDDATTPENMQLSTQLVSFLASLALLLPMYLLGRQFFDHTVSFAGTLLYQYLPISAQHLSDGISEPIYLLLLVSGLLFMARAIRERNVWSCAACGFFAGLAYLVRPEGLLIVPAFGLALILAQFRADWRSPRGRFFACGAAMVLTAMLVGSIYVYATGRITSKLSAIETLNNLRKMILNTSDANAEAGGSVHLFAVTFTPSGSKAVRLTQSASAFGKELLQGLHYAGIVPALLGLWWSFAALRRCPGFWGVAIYAMIHSLILIALAMSVSYVSDRHVMILVLFGSFFVVVGMRELPRKVFTWTKFDSGGAWYRSATTWFIVLYALLIAASLPKATQRLHGTRVANHQAGLWLAEHVRIGDVVVDDHAWSNYYAGMVFQEGRETALPMQHEGICYVVATRSNDASIDAQRRTAFLNDDARVVCYFPERGELAKARVVIHAQLRKREQYPWRLAPE